MPDAWQMEVDARLVSGEAGSCGLGFGFDWGESTYEGHQFRIAPHAEQTMLEKRDVDGTWTTLLDWTDASAIQQGTASNHLTVSREGEDLRLHVNGVHLASCYEPSFLGYGRDGGVRARSQAAVPIDARFDSFRVSCAP